MSVLTQILDIRGHSNIILGPLFPSSTLQNQANFFSSDFLTGDKCTSPTTKLSCKTT